MARSNRMNFNVRQAIEKMYKLGMSNQEIADEMGYTRQAIVREIYRGIPDGADDYNAQYAQNRVFAD